MTEKKTSPGLRSKSKFYDEKNKIEWSVFALSLVLVLGIVGFLIYQVINHQPVTPNMHVDYKKDPSPDNPYRYLIILNNTGGETAEDIRIEGDLIKNGSMIESSELVIDYSPKWSHRKGYLNFANDPSLADSIRVKVMSYKKS